MCALPHQVSNACMSISSCSIASTLHLPSLIAPSITPLLATYASFASLSQAHVLRSLKRITLACNPVRLALADNLLAEPFGLEAAVQDVQIRDDILAAADDSLLGCDGAVGLDAQLEGGEERVGNLVGGEDDVLVLEEALGEEVAERVVFLVEREDGRVGYTWSAWLAVVEAMEWQGLTGLLLVLDFRLPVV
jgi:hypothetical protein